MKTSLEEAKVNYQEIKKFATEAAKKEFENEINDKIEKILKESLSIEIDDENNITVAKDEKVVELTNDGEVEVEDMTTHDNEENDESHFDDDEEIEIEKNIDEMITIEQDQPQSPEATPMGDSTAPAPEETNPVDNDVLELAQLIDKIIDKKVSGGESGSEQGVDVDYIDDETAANPASEVPTEVPAPAPAPAPAPVQEDELLEFSLEEINNMGENMMEFDIPEDEEYFTIDDDPEAKELALSDITSEKPDWKKSLPKIDLPTAEEELDEVKMMGQSNSVQKTTGTSVGPEIAVKNRSRQTSSMPVNENKKAQNESKIDELLKENKRLNESNKEFSEVIKNYQESFKDLRKQFDEMQTFNAKLAYANKIFASGGLSTTDKARIAEEFDKTQTVEEAKKLYNKILEENKIVVVKDNSSKIKATITNTVKAKEVVYESAEMKRRKVLAGIEKNEDYI